MTLPNKQPLKSETITLITVISCVLIFSFFIRWFNFFGLAISGYDIVFSSIWDTHSQENFWNNGSRPQYNYIALFRYLLLAGPLISAYILYSLHVNPSKSYDLSLNKIPFAL